MNREAKLRAALEGTGMEDQAAGLASRTAAEVDMLIALVKASGRVAVAREKAKQRQRRANKNNGRGNEFDQIAAAIQRLTDALAKQAAEDVLAFGALVKLTETSAVSVQVAAEGLIAADYSYSEIGQELGITRQAAWKRFGRKPKVDAGSPQAGDPA